MSTDAFEPSRLPDEMPDVHEAFPRFTPDQMTVLERWGGRRTTEAGEVLAVPVQRLKDVALHDSVPGETILRAYLIRRAALIEVGSGIRIIGSCYSRDTRRLLEFTTRNRLPHRWIDVEEEPETDAFLQRMNVGISDTPVVVLTGGRVLRNPSNSVLADELGLRTLPGRPHCDLLIVGAGPAGLAASVYGASDGLDVTIVDATALGEQASTTSRIENYPGFPAGIPGGELTERTVIQARRFGACVEVPATVTSIADLGDCFRAELDGHHDIHPGAVLDAMGAVYRRLKVKGFDRFETGNVFYEATVKERQACGADPVAVVGGGNSAGQAAVFLARTTPTVYLIVRDRNVGAPGQPGSQDHNRAIAARITRSGETRHQEGHGEPVGEYGRRYVCGQRR